MNEKRNDNLIWEAYSQLSEGWPAGTMGPGGGPNDPQVHGADDEERLTPEEENTKRSKQLAEDHFYEIDELIKAELVSRRIKEHQKESFAVMYWGKLLGDKLAENADMDVVAYWRAMEGLITAGYSQAVYIDVTNALKPQIDELR
tara:strand:- start:145 stop:579 length:435 start_codon:yes stop_codon:yes gene_type:complete